MSAHVWSQTVSLLDASHLPRRLWRVGRGPGGPGECCTGGAPASWAEHPICWAVSRYIGALTGRLACVHMWSQSLRLCSDSTCPIYLAVSGLLATGVWGKRDWRQSGGARLGSFSGRGLAGRICFRWLSGSCWRSQNALLLRSIGSSVLCCGLCLTFSEPTRRVSSSSPSLTSWQMVAMAGKEVPEVLLLHMRWQLLRWWLGWKEAWLTPNILEITAKSRIWCWPQAQTGSALRLTALTSARCRWSLTRTLGARASLCDSNPVLLSIEVSKLFHRFFLFLLKYKDIQLRPWRCQSIFLGCLEAWPTQRAGQQPRIWKWHNLGALLYRNTLLKFNHRTQYHKSFHVIIVICSKGISNFS